MKSCICRGGHAPAPSDDDGTPLTELRDTGEGEDNEAMTITESPRPTSWFLDSETLQQPLPPPPPPPPPPHPLVVTEQPQEELGAKREVLTQERRLQKKRMVRQEWSFTLYDFDGRGEVTRDDLSTIMKSLSEVLGSQNKVNRERRGFQLRLTMSEEQEGFPGRKSRCRQSRSEKRQRRLTNQAESCPKDEGGQKEIVRRKRDSKSCEPPSVSNDKVPLSQGAPQLPLSTNNPRSGRPDKRQRHRERRELAMNHVTDWLLRDDAVPPIPMTTSVPPRRLSDAEQERCVLPDDRIPKVVIHEHKHVHEHHHYHHPCQS